MKLPENFEEASFCPKHNRASTFIHYEWTIDNDIIATFECPEGHEYEVRFKLVPKEVKILD